MHIFAIVKEADLKTAKKHKKALSFQRIDINEDKYFFIINAPLHKGKYPKEKILSYAGNLRNSVIFPDDEPKESNELSALRLFNTAVTLIEKKKERPQGLSLCLYDKKGLFTHKAHRLLSLVSTLHVICPEKERYESFVRRMLYTCGASVSLSESWCSAAQLCGTVIASDCDILPLSCRARVYCTEKKPLPDAELVVVRGVQLPYCYERLRPFGTDKTLFASALYDKCGISEAEFWEHDSIIGY